MIKFKTKNCKPGHDTAYLPPFQRVITPHKMHKEDIWQGVVGTKHLCIDRHVSIYANILRVPWAVGTAFSVKFMPSLAWRTVKNLSKFIARAPSPPAGDSWDEDLEYWIVFICKMYINHYQTPGLDHFLVLLHSNLHRRGLTSHTDRVAKFARVKVTFAMAIALILNSVISQP